jgi:hypothetical protein
VTIGKKKLVAVSLLKLDERLQCRESVPEETIRAYEDGWREKIEFPPVEAFEVEGELYVTDGFCRVLSAQNVGKSKVPCLVRKGSWQDAVAAACGANSQHGLPRTNADKRKAATMAILEFSDKPNREIARICGVSHTYIDNLRIKQNEADEIVEAITEGKELPASKPKPSPKPKAAPKPDASIVSPAGWRCSDCHGTEQRLTDGGYVCRACLLPVPDGNVAQEPEQKTQDDEAQEDPFAIVAEPPQVATLPVGQDPIPDEMPAVHTAWGKFIRACGAAKCDQVLRAEIESITKKLKGLR